MEVLSASDPIELIAQFLRKLYWLKRQEVPELEGRYFFEVLGHQPGRLRSVVAYINEICEVPVFRLRKGEILEVRDELALGRFASQVIDPRVFADLYTWQDFERFIHDLCYQFGFQCTTNFRFTRVTSKKRWEIDIIAVRGALILSIDGKRWAKKGTVPSALKQAALNQLKRTRDLRADRKALEMLFGTLGTHWGGGVIVPVISTARTSPLQLTKNKIPIVSIYQFQAFLESVDDFIENLCSFRVPALPRQTTL